MPGQRKLLIVIAGPTAVGKTSMAIEVASHFESEIISSDSRQIYKEMTIGTAKPSKEELARIPHHFIGSVSIFEPYNTGMYERDALRKISELHDKHDIVIVSGGTGLYIKAILEGLDSFPEVPAKILEKWVQHFREHGLSFLQESLQELDPDYYAIVDRANHRRLIRALTVTDASGTPYSNFLSRAPEPRPFLAHCFTLVRNRETLYAHINERVDMMLEKGLMEEVERLFPHRHLRALKTVGYQEFFKYLEGNITYDEAVRQVKAHTRQYAKRQMTWFRNQGTYMSWDADDISGLIRHLSERVRKLTGLQPDINETYEKE